MSLEGEVRFNVFFRLGKRGFKKMIEVQSNTNEDFEVLLFLKKDFCNRTLKNNCTAGYWLIALYCSSYRRFGVF